MSRAVVHPVDAYARDVLAGRIVAGPLVRLACERHVRDRRAKRWIFDQARADHILEFFRLFLRLPDVVDEDGEPKPFALAPWQEFVLGSIFGWVDADGCRRFRDGYVEAGKGCGKTPMLAGVGLYGLLMDGERAAEIYAAATTRDQADVLFRDAKRIVEASPALRARVQVGVNNIAYTPTMSFFRPFSRDEGQRSGPRPHMGLIDEVHEHATGEVIHKIKAGVKRRRQPLMLEITNSGFDRTTICWEHHEHSRRVLERQVEDDRWFGYVCGLDAGEDPLTTPACWPKANPAIGVTIGRDYLERVVQNAKNIPAETNTVLRLNFCVWTTAQTRFFKPGEWEACAAQVPEEALLGMPAYGGLDLGQSDDFTAWVVAWPLLDGRIVARVRFWLPESALEQFPDRPYAAWQRAGVLEVTPGNTTDYDSVEAAVLADCRRWGVREVAYDKRFAEQLAQHLVAAGVTMLDQPQGFGLNLGIKFLSELVAAARLCHGGHPVLAWMADNFVTRLGSAKEQRPDKEKARDKIDGIVALVMALQRLAVQPVYTSIYDARGLVVIGED